MTQTPTEGIGGELSAMGESLTEQCCVEYADPSRTELVQVKANFRIDWHTLNIIKKDTMSSLELRGYQEMLGLILIQLISNTYYPRSHWKRDYQITKELCNTSTEAGKSRLTTEGNRLLTVPGGKTTERVIGGNKWRKMTDIHMFVLPYDLIERLKNITNWDEWASPWTYAEEQMWWLAIPRKLAVSTR